MAQRIREFDWSASQLGDPGGWPQALKLTLNLLINNKFPMFLWWGPDLLCFYNDAYRPSLGNNGKHPGILGMPAAQAWPEIWDYIYPLINKVITDGESVFMEDLLLPIFRNGEMQDVYWTFAYSPVIDDTGVRVGVLVTCHETTQKMALLQHLRESERRFQSFVRNASVGIVVLTGKNLEVAVVNDAYGRLIGRTVDELLGRPLFDVIPETEAEYKPILENVLTSGESVTFVERPYQVQKGDKTISGYLDLVYQPFVEIGGAITGVMALCHDVTHQVESQMAVKTTLDQLRLSKEAAQLGMFDMDLKKGTMEWDSRCRTLFGISHSGTVTYERDFVLGLHPDDRERITAIIDGLFARSPESGDYDVEYRTVGAEDGQLRWVRAKGKVYFDAKDKPVRFIGSVIDITPQKVNETRKNDFITMVSHELKTPLTSLMGYLQLLIRNADETADEFQAGILSRAHVQTKKMNGMINGFLNVSRFESGKLELQPAVFSLDRLLWEIVDGLNVGANNRIDLASAAIVEVRADREKIESVITNLISNAIKYSADAVTVTCERTEDAVIVCIADRGIGIKEEDRSYIFDRFYRVDDKQTRDIGGFGIGLYLSSEIVKMHGGALWVDSEYGKGSRFYFSLPTLSS